VAFDGHVVVVELAATDWISAHFIAPPGTDIVSGRPSAAVYAPDRRGYAMTNADCERMVADMIAFFSGAREPRFRLRSRALAEFIEDSPYRAVRGPFLPGDEPPAAGLVLIREPIGAAEKRCILARSSGREDSPCMCRTRWTVRSFRPSCSKCGSA